MPALRLLEGRHSHYGSCGQTVHGPGQLQPLMKPLSRRAGAAGGQGREEPPLHVPALLPPAQSLTEVGVCFHSLTDEKPLSSFRTQGWAN